VAGPFRGEITRRFLASFLDVLLQLRGVDIRMFLAGILLSRLAAVESSLHHVVRRRRPSLSS